MGLIENWLEPEPFDAVRNEYRTFVGERDSPAFAQAYFMEVSPEAYAENYEVMNAIVELGMSSDPQTSSEVLAGLVAQENMHSSTRIAALRGLQRQDSDLLGDALLLAAADSDEAMREASAEILAKLKPEFTTSLAQGFATLAAEGSASADNSLAEAMDALLADRTPPALRLELIEAVNIRADAGSASLQTKLQAWKNKMDALGKFAQFDVTLEGGDPVVGKRVFIENVAAGCTRCHGVEGMTGQPSEVGPDLSSIGIMRTRGELLASIIEPAKAISPGFEMFDDLGHVMPVSAMLPNYSSTLSPREIRDLVAYLASLRKPKRIAIVVHSAGYEHAVAKRVEGEPSVVEQLWMDWDKQDERFEATVIDDPKWLSSPALAEMDAVFFYTTGDLPIGEEGRQALVKYIEEGGGFVGSHCASDTFMEWPWFGEMVGGFFDGHPWNSNSEVTIKVEAPEHSSCDHLPKPWVLVDEIYQFREPYDREKLDVLLSLDPDGTDMAKKGMNRTDGDYAVAWTKKQGKGRVFYTSLGHREDVWRNPLFKEHLIEGFLWAAR